MNVKPWLRSLLVLAGLLMMITILLVTRTENRESPIPVAPTETNEPAAAPPVEDGRTLSEGEVAQIMETLIGSDQNEAVAAIESLVDANDRRFVSVLIELYRGWQLGLVRSLNAGQLIDALESLSGQSLGDDWSAWVEWYGSSDLRPPPGFTGWKGKILSFIDPRFGDFLSDDLPSRIRVEEIQWGGVRVDGIPALDEPTMLAAEDAGYLNAEDPVFGIAINGEARAYPLRILDWHEMANDVVGGVPVSLAYCTLCGAAIAYDGRHQDRTFTFGSSGFLFRSNKLMYDRQTRTLWNQLTGEPVLGELVDEDIRLELLPVVLTSWQAWQRRHPDTMVVDINTGFDRDYAPGAAYGHYFAADETMFPVAQRSSLLDTKAQIYALRIEGIPIAYPLDLLIDDQVLNDTVAGTNLVLIAPREKISVEGTNLRVGAVTYVAGGEVRAYQRGEQHFVLGPDGDSLLDGDGRVWQIGEDALTGPDGQKAPRLPGHLAYWFGWFAFFPNTLVYGQ